MINFSEYFNIGPLSFGIHYGSHERSIPLYELRSNNLNYSHHLLVEVELVAIASYRVIHQVREELLLTLNYELHCNIVYLDKNATHYNFKSTKCLL